MSFKTITIKERVYKELEKAKEKGESFSDFFERMIREKKKAPDLRRFYGAWKMNDKEWKGIESTIKKRKETADKEYRKKLERLFNEGS